MIFTINCVKIRKNRYYIYHTHGNQISYRMIMEQHSPFGPEQDQGFMTQALRLAGKAFRADEVPVGALVVSQASIIIGRGYNRVMGLCSQAAHAEMRALSQAGKRCGDWRLSGCWIYVTLEPCLMCMNMILLSRLQGIVFGAPSPLFGYQKNVLDNPAILPLYKMDTISVVAGVREKESSNLLRQFFQQKRNSVSG